MMSSMLDSIATMLSSHPFAEFALLLGLVGLISACMKALRQPLII